MNGTGIYTFKQHFKGFLPKYIMLKLKIEGKLHCVRPRRGVYDRPIRSPLYMAAGGIYFGLKMLFIPSPPSENNIFFNSYCALFALILSYFTHFNPN
jgi:hypothetical protein